MIPFFVIVKQYERLAVFTLGKFAGMRDPGIRFLLWPIHTTRSVDLREDVIDIPRQTNITRDNAPIDIDFLIYLRVIEHEAQKSVLEVVNYRAAVVGIAIWGNTPSPNVWRSMEPFAPNSIRYGM